MANNGDIVDNNNLQGTPISSNPSPNPKPKPIPNDNNGESLVKSSSPRDFILSVASKIASQPLQYSDPDVWGVLTAISTKARQRRQGINILLTSDEHLIGRTVADSRFQILSNQISQHHCKVYRKKVATEDAEGQSRLFNCGYLKDTSTNGTFLNWEKLNKNSPESKLQHGDIISFAAPPHHDLAFAFVFREVLQPTSGTDSRSPPLKRKTDELGSESKRLRGIGISASEGPISLDNFRSLQRSNTELRKQLEDQVATVDQLCNENRAAIELREAEKKNLKESISKTYVDELKEMCDLFEAKQKELVEVYKISSKQNHAMVDLSKRLKASVQSCTEANEIMRSQNASITELKILLHKKREQRKQDRKKAVANLTASIQRVKAEAQEELKRLSDASLRRENEQQEILNKLQESEKERCSLVETLRSKLEDTRHKLVGSENKVRQLESQLSQEQRLSSIANKGINKLLNSDEHLIGRTAADSQILSNQISQHYCKVYKKKVATKDVKVQSRLFNCGYLKDTSTNGTFLNWEKLNKNSPESKLQHGDITSFAASPLHDEFGSESESKRLRGIGIGASEGPISLDDFRSLQRSNTKNLRMHPAMYDDRTPRCSQRLISAKETRSLISSKRTTVQDFSESSSTGSRSDRDDEDSFYGYNSKRKRIPLGQQFQAKVPESTQQTYLFDPKWAGFPVWPLEKTETRSSLIERERVGKGRQDSCGCEFPGSLECVRFHISEKRNRTKLELGSAFYRWKFDNMGEEDVALKWTPNEEKKFEDIIKANPPSSGITFWDDLWTHFKDKKMSGLVSYYFNVYLLRRRAHQNRSDPSNIDSDDDKLEKIGNEANNNVPGSIFCSPKKVNQNVR